MHEWRYIVDEEDSGERGDLAKGRNLDFPWNLIYRIIIG